MSGDFITLIGAMTLVFSIALIPGLFSRCMDRSDYLTLVMVPLIMFPVAVLPSILINGFDKNAAVYVLGALIVLVVATVNYRFQPKAHPAREAPGMAGSPRRTDDPRTQEVGGPWQ